RPPTYRDRGEPISGRSWTPLLSVGTDASDDRPHDALGREAHGGRDHSRAENHGPLFGGHCPLLSVGVLVCCATRLTVAREPCSASEPAELERLRLEVGDVPLRAARRVRRRVELERALAVAVERAVEALRVLGGPRRRDGRAADAGDAGAQGGGEDQGRDRLAHGAPSFRW